MKARVVAGTLLPGATVNEVAPWHGLSANHVSSWRTLARKGRLVLPAPEDPVEFAALMVDPVDETGGGDAGAAAGAAVRPEIVAGTVVIRPAGYFDVPLEQWGTAAGMPTWFWDIAPRAPATLLIWTLEAGDLVNRHEKLFIRTLR